MPGPVSVTVRPASWPSRHSCTRTLPPEPVYLMALSTRLVITSSNRGPSASTSAPSPATSSASPLAWAIGRSLSTTSLTSSSSRCGAHSRSRRPSSMRASVSRLSRMRLIRSTGSSAHPVRLHWDVELDRRPQAGRGGPLLDHLQSGALDAFVDTIQHVLVDEYQDTNLLQEAIYFHLARCALTRGGSIAVVGHADQALFRFRGATVELFRDFPTHANAALSITP